MIINHITNFLSSLFLEKKVLPFNCLGKRYIITLLIFIISGLLNHYLLILSVIESVILLLIEGCFIIVFLVDNKEFIIPDTINLSLFILGVLIFILAIDNLFLGITNITRIVSLLISFFILLITLIFDKIFKKEILGYGDIKLFFGVSLIFGTKILLMGIFVASFIACIIEVIIRKSKKNPIAFGPYLVIGFILSYYFTEFLSQIQTIFIFI